eukprot:CAMPEP_0194285090 /NCGR_PEP_ID=MMETSP0169-20130528/29360_1 /TAXON_ID=218684 /ORGANISM="Corethron pennatum, Strain L29A3" /LENGTH=144 /DNA_ID=CAMNT_0039031121 /DNA_START=146 /DNA_END=580 /DNA_ORIENTATION=+
MTRSNESSPPYNTPPQTSKWERTLSERVCLFVLSERPLRVPMDSPHFPSSFISLSESRSQSSSAPPKLCSAGVFIEGIVGEAMVAKGQATIRTQAVEVTGRASGREATVVKGIATGKDAAKGQATKIFLNPSGCNISEEDKGFI